MMIAYLTYRSLVHSVDEYPMYTVHTERFKHVS